MDEKYAALVASRFGPRLRELRGKAKLTQATLAKMCGVRQASIADYELGKTTATWPNVVKIAHALGVTPDAFLREPDQSDTDSVKQKRNSG